MTNKKETEIKLSEEVKMWNESNIGKCVLEFSCGGDSMNDTTFAFYDKDGKKMNKEGNDLLGSLESYFEDVIYERVEFYVNSDGYYIGEFGTVVIEFDEDSNDFTYVKSAMSEYSESVTNVVDVKLNKAEVKFLKKYVANINGSYDEIQGNINFSKDFVYTPQMEKMVERITEKIGDACEEHEFNFNGTIEDYFIFTTDIDDKETLTLEDEVLKVSLRRNFIVQTES